MAKRIFDVVFSIIALVLFSWVMLLSYLAASIDTGANGFFSQKRIGRLGKPFTILKVRTIHPKTGKISAVGNFFRNSKIDELPQFFNVLLGCMSIVGPRPDVAGYYDKLEGEERKILALKPGITCPASIKYYNEETLLQQQENPMKYNDTVIFPDKVKMNLDYYYNNNFWGDLVILWKTFFR